MTRARRRNKPDRPFTVTLITPMRRHKSMILRAEFVANRLWPSLMGIAPLESVHFTHWTLLTSIPYNGPPQIAERPPQPYLVWESLYSGVFDPYVESFVAAIKRQINYTWRWSYGYPGTASIGALKRYIQTLEQPCRYLYTAHPEASVRMILAALEVAREHEFLLGMAYDDAVSDAEFEMMYDGFLRRRQADL